jgi:hypothetical protein
MADGTPSERLAVLKSRVTTDTVQPSDHADALTLCSVLLEQNEALTLKVAETDGWRDLLASNVAALHANEAHLAVLGQIQTRAIEADERWSNAVDRATGSRMFWPTVILCILLVGGVAGVFTFDKISLQIPGVTSGIDTEALDALPTSEQGEASDGDGN